MYANGMKKILTSRFNYKALIISVCAFLLIGIMCICAGGKSVMVGAFLFLSLTVGLGYGIIFGTALRRKEKDNEGDFVQRYANTLLLQLWSKDGRKG